MAIALRLPGSSSTLRRPRLATTSAPTSRRMAWIAGGIVLIVAVLMAMTVYVHIQIAERQVQINALEQEIRTAQTNFDALRAERAIVRSPEHIYGQALELGMVHGQISDYVAADPDAVAIVVAQTGLFGVDSSGGVILGDADPLEQFRQVKMIRQETP